MGRSRFSWALGVIAPWCLGMGVVISCTADAGQDLSFGASEAFAAAHAPAAPFEFMPPSGRGLASLTQPASAAHTQLASLHIGDLAAASDDEGDPPRISLKHNARGWPAPDRSHRGDPAVLLRPGFDARWRLPGGVDAARANSLMLDAEGSLAFAALAPADGVAPGPDSVASLDAWREPDLVYAGERTRAQALTTSAAAGATPSLSGAGGNSRGLFDGATPRAPRAVALASSTPAAADLNPVEVLASAIIARPWAPQVGRDEGGASILVRPDYASLIDQDGGSEERCLAEAVYFEARGEPEDGQAAVAQVVLNRVKSGLYPSTICGVVFQNRHRHNACQFSFACDGHPLRITESDAWKAASTVAHRVLEGDTWLAEVGGATHYHANYVRPRWARALKKVDTIGRHVFYTLRPGQT